MGRSAGFTRLWPCSAPRASVGNQRTIGQSIPRSPQHSARAAAPCQTGLSLQNIPVIVNSFTASRLRRP
jgi:hypothetical protein